MQPKRSSIPRPHCDIRQAGEYIPLVERAVGRSTATRSSPNRLPRWIQRRPLPLGIRQDPRGDSGARDREDAEEGIMKASKEKLREYILAEIEANGAGTQKRYMA